jgi:hypothetical protein
MLESRVRVAFESGQGAFGTNMACTACGSESLLQLDCEVTASFRRAEDVKAPPVYFAQQLWVCLECGFAELRVPAAQLEVLRKNRTLHS